MANSEVINGDLAPGTPWEEIRSLVELGVPASKVSKAYHISESTISHRKKLEQWATPREVSAKARELLAAEMGDPDDENPLLTRRAKELIGKHMDLREVAHGLVKKGMDEMAKTLRVPATFFEAEAAMRIADKAAGLESGPSRSGQAQAPGSPGNSGNCAINVTFLTPPQSSLPLIPSPNSPRQDPPFIDISPA